MSFVRQQLFSFKFKFLLSILAFLSIGMTTLTWADKAKAVSNVSISFFKDGTSPNSYGPEVFDGDGVYQYVYEVGFFSDDAAIDTTSLKYEIDGGNVHYLYDDITYDGGTEVDVRVLVEPVGYADGNAHTIKFSGATVDNEPVEETLPLEPTPDITPPDVYFDTYTEGTITDENAPYVFNVSDYNLVNISAEVDGYFFAIAPYDSSYDYANYDINLATDNPPVDVFDGAEHTFSYHVEDPYGNVTDRSYAFTYDDGGMGPVDDGHDPVMDITSADEGPAGNPLHYEGTVDDESDIDYVQYSIDFAGRQTVPTTGTNTHKDFTINLPNQAGGDHNVQFFAGDEWGHEVESQLYEVTIDATAPSCTESFYNLPSPHYSKTLSYANISCTDNVGITSAAYNVYHSVQGTLQAFDDFPVPAKDGNFDSTTETFDFTVDLTGFGDIDGNVFIGFRACDAGGNCSNDYDPIIIEASDNTAPVVNLDEVTPDPLTDSSPTITGSCRDATQRETNTNISLMEYKVDADSYTDIPLPDSGVYNDSTTESFSFDLPDLADGAHTVTVQCTDGASHSSTAEDTFTIQNPISPQPGEFNYTESFDNTDNQDIPNSTNMVWGNGKLRLKEELAPSRTDINTTEPCDKYGECRGNYGVWQDPQDANVLWYYQFGKIYTYNTSSHVNTQFDYVNDYSMSQLGDLKGFELGMYNGKKYLVMSDIYNLVVINLTDNESFKDPFLHDINSLALDFTRGRQGVYMSITATGGNSNLAYLDLGGTIDESDDVLTRIPLSTLNSTNFLNILVDPTSNAIYSGTYNEGFYKFGDNNDPTDTASYQVTTYDDGAYANVFSAMTLDPDHHLIFGTANVSNARLFVINDDGGTPFDSSDDTVTQLANPLQLGYHNLYGIQYIDGQNGVGDQLLLTTESDNPIYFNFNDTYENLTDDTTIEIETRDGKRPGSVSAYLKDYNDLYVEVKNQGFFKVSINRGWADSGSAVALPTRPPQQLVVDNFTAEASAAVPISYIPGESQSFMARLGRQIVPFAQAADGDGIHYFVSTDGGVTYTEVTLGELQQLQQTDYRVKFKIEMDEVGGATPVLNSYSLDYAGYPDEAQADTTTGLTVSPSTYSTTTSGNFNLTVEAVDVLGYKTPSYNGSVSLSLVDTGSNTVVPGLSVSNGTITNGTVSFSNVQITSTGSYKIRATSGSFTQDSGTITVTGGASLNSPYLGFSASSFKIKKGETVTLHWTSNNLTSFIINPGDNHLSASTGDFYVHPTETTTYTMTGDGPYGSASSSLEIKVEGEVSSSPGPSPTPGASASPTASDSAEAARGSLNPDGALTITASEDQTIVRGQKAEVSWDVPGADEVTVDYPTVHTVSPKGSFEFFPTDTTTITITAKRGDETITKKIIITVLNAPVEVQKLARSIQERAPWAAPLFSKAIQAAKTLPVFGLSIAAIAEAGVVTLLVLTVISQAGLLAAFNGKTLLNLLSTAGILPAKQHKGFVHQTKNGAPIPFAAITVYESAKQIGVPFVTLVSDMYGVYLEPFLPKGSYTLVAGHIDHNFPTKASRPKHLGLKDFYKGEALTVQSNKEHPALLIPMDDKTGAAAKGDLKYKLLLFLNQLLGSLQWTVYPLSVVSVIALWLTPNIFNGIIVAIYVVLLIPKILLLMKRPVLQGRVVMDSDRRPIANSTLTLATTDGNVVAVSKSDAQGNYEFFAPKGTYVLNVVSSNLLWKDNKAGTLNTVNVGATKKPLTISMAKIENPFGGF